MRRAGGKTANCRALQILALGAAGIVTPAAAQTAAPALSQVTQAPVPEGSLASEASMLSFGPKGMPLGAFRLFPTLEATGDYDDNVFLTETDTQSDYFFRETPQFVLRSDWSRHLLDIYGSASLYQYSSLLNQNHIDWTAGGDGRLDIHHGIAFAVSGAYSFNHLANSSPNQPSDAKSPTGFSLGHSTATLSYNPYHFGFYLGGTYDRFDYDPSLLVDGSRASNADRNESAYSGYVKTSYEFSPGYALFLQAAENVAQYDQRADRSGFDRSNNGLVATGGLDMLVTNLIRGNVFLGYLNQQYKAPLKDVAGLTYGANVDWYATPLWTFHLVASRALNGTVLTGASTEDDRSVQVIADFRADPQILITGSVGYLDASQDGSPRVDRYVTARGMVGYILNPWITAELSDTFQTRNSTIRGQNFNDNVVMLGLKFQE